ncbi:MAG: bifunctional salicylyl-CoA 5-hydroxylase/oxidoreductase [Alphaproteobacteria bacterium]|nr:bifunctional salicylyl-CoA 5-hydroxylase/oxidoreductase [Alphaproteobacteria bacterium]
MRIACVGGGPASLYFALLYKKRRPDAEVVVFERNPPQVTWGFGVVFSDATMAGFGNADEEVFRQITQSFAHWDDIDIHFKGETITSTGHGFAGMSRLKLLDILGRRAFGLGVELFYQNDLTDLDRLKDFDLIVAGDGVNSFIRERYKAEFQTDIETRPNKFTWLGTTKPFGAFTFYFVENEHGLWRAHCYQYEPGMSTFIVECTEETWKRAGLDRMDEDTSRAYCERVFAKQLDGHGLIPNRSIWRSFPRVKNGRWHHNNIVLVGDALHTAHFSIGSGTKLAMEDAVALARALEEKPNVAAALDAYETERRPTVDSLQRAAQVSMEWFEETERYHRRLEPVQFAFSLLTRSLRITHDNLKVRDPGFIRRVDAWFARSAANQSGVNVALQPLPPPMFTPFRLRELIVPNRIVVSPMCQYSAEDGTVDDWQLVHLGSRAIGGAGLIMTEMTDVSREGRITPGCAGMYKPEHVGAWRRVVDFVHKHSPAKVGLQLAHAGRKGSTKLIWDGIDEPLPQSNWPLLGPTPIPYTLANQVPRAMTRADMDTVRADFVRATEMAEEAGFDIVEVHFAHGYLLSTFLSPLTNRRTDEYGGSLANRMRYPLEVFEAVRASWPQRKPISVRISATDWAPGGTTPDDAVALAQVLKRRGCDIVDVSAGQVVAKQRPIYGRLFQTPFADRVRLEAEMPTMTVGNIQSHADVNSILVAGRADLCVLARAHLFDPYWTRHAAVEQGWRLPQPPQYGSIDDYQPRLR